MLKIQSFENNNFDRIKKFHKTKYLGNIKDKLSEKSKQLQEKGYNLESKFLEKLKSKLEEILIGELDEIESAKAELHPHYENVKDNIVKFDKYNISMKELTVKIFNYEDFSKGKLYHKSIDTMIVQKRLNNFTTE